MQISQVKLHKGREQSILRRHPWVFSRAIQSPINDLLDGDLVKVMDHRERIIGVGHFQNSSLSIRMLAFEDVAIDELFWKTKLQEALAYRLSLDFIKQGITNAFRLVHGEGDQLPGLIIDIYDTTAVMQAHSIGMHKARHLIADSLMHLDGLQINAVYCKSEDALPSAYAKEVKDEWLVGNPTENLIVREGGIMFGIDVVTGQKTGFFLDQRNNRELVRQHAHGKSVLNCFCYTGGFSLYALEGGATGVISVDTSAGALDILDNNLKLNVNSGTHQSIKENVLTYLTQSDEQYDIVIVDPPAFAKTLSKRHNA
ncbi:MAG: class I SAM-dependent rRNA methyltransferase, partial [Bacteroidota bacterium]|nr:class I SAM-dependent rRNA methyltransferase [Bacteroidota bacterium]